ncbi:MAG: hypothetical protein V5A39_05870 [Haloarculaceae archaeon]|jgi:hypothetical protein
MIAILPVLAAGLRDAVGGALALAGSIVLVLMLVALGTYAYKNLRGDGIEWPDDKPDPAEDDEIRQGDDEDEWKYY